MTDKTTLSELDEVMAQCDKADEGSWKLWANDVFADTAGDSNIDTANQVLIGVASRTFNTMAAAMSVNFLREHHATLRAALVDAESIRIAAVGHKSSCYSATDDGAFHRVELAYETQDSAERALTAINNAIVRSLVARKDDE